MLNLNAKNYIKKTDIIPVESIFHTTIVSCYIKIYDNEPFDFKTPEWRISQFRKIASTGIPICLYGCSQTLSSLLELEKEFPKNVKVIRDYDIYSESIIYKHCILSSANLPEKRNTTKDTHEYMALMNSKIELVHDTLQKNPWKTDNFAWLDFSAAYLFFKDTQNTITKLQKICCNNNKNDRKYSLYIPGCWNLCESTLSLKNSQFHSDYNYTEKICWRFCGTFFIGDNSSILKFYKDYLYYFPLFLQLNNVLVWETNFWAWLEQYSKTCKYITWYCADHNDSMICNLSSFE